MSHFHWRGCAPRTIHACQPQQTPRGCGPTHRWWGGPSDEMDDEGFGGFGVRRPLRFLAHRLDLDDRQVGEFARILDELKTERAQAEVDRRRTLTAFADALSGENFDSAKAGEAGNLRASSAARVRDAVLKALQQIHGELNAEQRVKLAYLIRTGTLSL
jgi:Spy/CpxP family protein refolding chaperone